MKRLIIATVIVSCLTVSAAAKVDLELNNTPSIQVLRLLAQKKGLNLVANEQLSKPITLTLKQVDWQQAIDSVLASSGLSASRQGNLLIVTPASEATKPILQTKLFQLNYANAENLKELLADAYGKEQLKVAVDKRINALVITGAEAQLNQTQLLLEQLDVSVKQVEISSRIVSINTNATEDLGIRWGFTANQNNIKTSGGLNAVSALVNNEPAKLLDRLNVSFPVTSRQAGRIGLQLAKLGQGQLLDLELSALETENRGEIIATPKITTANQKTAYIEQGTEIPYVQTASHGTTTVSFKKAVLSLQVTPHITPDKHIILELMITQDTRGDTVATATGPAVAINTQKISTQVLVKNGETLVLGGIYQQNTIKAENKIPLFSQLPIIGKAFQQSHALNEKKELLIFVTPRIVNH